MSHPLSCSLLIDHDLIANVYLTENILLLNSPRTATLWDTGLIGMG